MADIMDGSEVADVLVIGAGAAGSVAVKHLAANSVDVVCLEQGPKVSASDYWGDKPEWEIMAESHWNPNPNARNRKTDYPIDVTDCPINPLNFNGVGGSTIFYAAHWERLTPSDFCSRSQDGVGDNWPITYAELEPFFDEMDIEMGVSGLGGDPAYPEGKAPPLPPLPMGKAGIKAARAFHELGWHWWPGPNAIASKPYRGRDACGRFATCMWGCPARAKGSMDLTHWPQALKHGAKLITEARVSEITLREDGLVDGAIFIDRDGQERKQRARAVIVCCNGIGTPRLLLNSHSSRFPGGLANTSGLVGKNLMMHPYGVVLPIFDEPIASWMGPAGQLIHSM